MYKLKRSYESNKTMYSNEYTVETEEEVEKEFDNFFKFFIVKKGGEVILRLNNLIVLSFNDKIQMLEIIF